MSLIKKNVTGYSDISRIVIDGFDFSYIKLNANQLYDILANYLLDKENLFYYCTQRSSSRTLKDSKKYVKDLLNNGTIKTEINTILTNLRWNYNSININSSKFCGDLGEYLMCIIIESFDISNTLISKISLKTSPNMPSFGNDNIFYDYKNNILYFGEAKFYKNTSSALKEAYKSINMHKNNFIEISYIKNHTSTFIAENNVILKKIEKKLETVDVKNVKCSSITFIVSDDKYEEHDYVNTLKKFAENSDDKKIYVNSGIIVFLPIVSKNDFLNYFKMRINEL